MQTCALSTSAWPDGSLCRYQLTSVARFLYVDNWQIRRNIVNATNEASNALSEFARISKLHVSKKKCWFCGTSATPRARKVLQVFSNSVHGGEREIKSRERSSQGSAIWAWEFRTISAEARRSRRVGRRKLHRNSSASGAWRAETSKTHLMECSAIRRLCLGCEATPLSAPWVLHWRRKVSKIVFPQLQGRRSFGLAYLLYQHFV